MKLKPCPFCKSKNILIKNVMDEFWVHCSLCSASSKISFSAEEAITAWNRRSSDIYLLKDKNP